MGGKEPQEDSEAAAPAEPEVPNAFDEYRRTHPGTLDRMFGDLAPGYFVALDAYERTGHLGPTGRPRDAARRTPPGKGDPDDESQQ